MNRIQNYIHGKKISFSKEEINVEDPSTGENIAKVVLSSEKDFQETLNSSKNKHLKTLTS